MVERNQRIGKIPLQTTSRTRRYTWLLAGAWTIVVLISLGWNVMFNYHQLLKVGRVQARIAYEKDILYRRWNANHGGVYAPITEKTQPNPYLDVPERDITTPSGRRLTMINPAYMTRQVHELHVKHGVLGNLTSLDPIRPENQADEWETRMLQTFETGSQEASELQTIAGIPYLRLMRPMVTEESCLKCHADQGYQVGDIRGGISVAIPMTPLLKIQRQYTIAFTTVHFGFWLIGFCGIMLGGQWIRRGEALYMKTAAELSRSQAFLQTVIDGIQEPVMVVNRRYQIILANPILKSLHPNSNGLNVSEVTCHEFIYGSPTPCREKACVVTQVIKSGRKATSEHTLVLSTGPQQGYEVTGWPLSNEYGEVSHVIVLYRNITEQKKIQETLIRTSRLEATATLAGGIAHDFNNLMVGVLGNAELLHEDLQHRPDLVDIVDVIRDAAQRASELSQQMLAYARGGKYIIRILDLNTIVQRILKLQKHTKHDNVELRLNLSSSLWKIKAAESQIGQVVMNLVINGFEAIGEASGTLSIMTDNLEIDHTMRDVYPDLVPGKYVYLAVEDDGCGMTEETISKAFDPFFTTKFQGRGLGLAASYGIIQNHHGHIAISSTENQGTIFKVYLPAVSDAIEPESVTAT